MFKQQRRHAKKAPGAFRRGRQLSSCSSEASPAPLVLHQEGPPHQTATYQTQQIQLAEPHQPGTPAANSRDIRNRFPSCHPERDPSLGYRDCFPLPRVSPCSQFPLATTPHSHPSCPPPFSVMDRKLAALGSDLLHSPLH